MKTRLSSLLALTLPLLGAAGVQWLPQDDTRGNGAPPPQEGDPKPDVPGNAGAGEFDIFGRRRVRTQGTFAERIQGGWRLVGMNIPGVGERGRAAQGFMHIGDGLLSMELHARWNADGAVPAANDIHASYTAEYRLTGDFLMTCSTVIGSYLDEDTGLLTWERAGYERQYRLQEQAGLLTLQFGDKGGAQGRMTFEPYFVSSGEDRDIFGRKKREGAGPAGLDIFGREAAPTSGEVDIFGRRKPAEDAKKKQPGDAPPPAAGGGDGGR